MSTPHDVATARTLRFALWLERRLAEIPPGGSVTVTFRRDRSGHLLREYHVQEGRILTDEHLDRGTDS